MRINTTTNRFRREDDNNWWFYMVDYWGRYVLDPKRLKKTSSKNV